MKSGTSLKFKFHALSGSSASGFTQIELMISIAIMAIFFLAIVAGFGPLAKGIFINKASSLGSNISQEQIEKLKAVSYYRLLITPSPQTVTVGSDTIYYDDTYYPPEQIQAGDIKFTRYTYVQVAQEVSGQIQTLAPTTTDTGLKVITVTVTWSDNGRYSQIKNIVSNPQVAAADAVIRGTVTDASTGLPLENVLIVVAENAGWIDITDVNGAYSLGVIAGSYNIVATAQGYFSGSILKSVASYATVTQDFSLRAMDSVTVSGTVWKNDHVVISQIVGSSECAATGFFQEYVELFNPTTSTVNIAPWGVAEIDLIYQGEDDAASRTLQLDYYVESIPSLSYYIIGNTTTLSVAGSTIAVDASFKNLDPEYPDIIKDPDAGFVGLAYSGTGEWIDLMGWDRNDGSKTAPKFETEGLNENVGLQDGEQYVRLCSTAGVTDGYGNCYDSDNNNVDFIRGTSGGTYYPPHNSSDTAVIIAGTPVAGAAVTINDGFSVGTNSYLSGSPPLPMFVLPSVATGTWMAIFCADGKLAEISTVTITGTGTTSIPNGLTDPPWDVEGYSSVFLSTTATQGYVSGKILNAVGAVISSPFIEVDDGYNTVSTDSNGNYLLQTSAGIYTINANGSRDNILYVSKSSANVTIEVGQITSGVDFFLSEGGLIRGFVTRDGVNPLPNILFLAEDTNGASQAEEVSGSDGYFNLVNLSTGTYDIYPVLDSGETSSPDRKSTPLTTAGATVFSATFTITGAFGEVAGRLSDGGEPINTGVLIFVTEETLTGTPPEPPAISSATLSNSAIYMGTSLEGGTYSVEVRGSTSTAYNVYAFYPAENNVNKYSIAASKYVTASSTTTVDFSTWLP